MLNPSYRERKRTKKKKERKKWRLEDQWSSCLYDKKLQIDLWRRPKNVKRKQNKNNKNKHTKLGRCTRSLIMSEPPLPSTRRRFLLAKYGPLTTVPFYIGFSSHILAPDQFIKFEVLFFLLFFLYRALSIFVFVLKSFYGWRWFDDDEYILFCFSLRRRPLLIPIETSTCHRCF